MHLWEILGICGILFLILEMFTPSMFFLNFVFASFFCAIISLYIKIPIVLVVVFFMVSFISFVFLRPILLTKLSRAKETGINNKYIGQKVLVEEDVTQNKGVISIYGERWDARVDEDICIEKGSEARIIRNESLIMFVEKI